MALLLKYRFATSFGLLVCMVVGHILNGQHYSHETHFQKYELGNLVKALALNSIENSLFKNEKGNSGSWLLTVARKTHQEL